MKKVAVIVFSFITLSIHSTQAEESTKVVVIPLNSSTNSIGDVPGSLKTVSVSSMGASLITSSGQETNHSDVCGSIGQYYNGPPANTFFFVPVQLPDGATITSFSGIFCDNVDGVSIFMDLQRSDDTEMASVISNSIWPSTWPSKKTDKTIVEPLVDNSQYAYYIRMTAGTSTYTGPDLYPISAHITLE